MTGTTGILDLGNVQIGVTEGTAHVTTQSSSIWAYGAWPQYAWLPFSGLAGAADNAVLYTLGSAASYNYHIVQNNSAVAVDVQVSADGVTYAAAGAAVLLHDDVTTGGGIRSATIPAGKVGVLRGKYMGVKVLQAAAGTINAAEVVGAHTVD